MQEVDCRREMAFGIHAEINLSRLPVGPILSLNVDIPNRLERAVGSLKNEPTHKGNWNQGGLDAAARRIDHLGLGLAVYGLAD